MAHIFSRRSFIPSGRVLADSEMPWFYWPCRWRLVLTFLLAIGICLFGQPVPLVAQENASLNFFSFGVNEGLSQGNVTCALRDHRGMMWFGTWDGINLYDGFRNQDFSHPSFNSQRIRGVLINNLLEIDSRQVAIATYIGLCIYNRDKTRFEYTTDEEAYRNCRILKRDHADLLLSSGSEIRRFHLQSRTFSNWNSPLQSVWKTWTRNRKNGVNRSEHLYGRMFDLLLKNPIVFQKIADLSDSLTLNDLVQVPGKNEWYLGCEEGLFRWNQDNGKMVATPLPEPVKCLFPYQQHLYIGTQASGLYILDFQHHTLHGNIRKSETSQRSLTGNYVRNLYIDSSGRIWLSILGGGINYAQLTPRRVRTLFSYADLPPSGRQDNYIQALAEDSSGHLWLYSLAGRLKRLDQENRQLRVYEPRDIDPLRLPGSVQQLFVSSSNQVYLLSNKGLYCWNGSNGFNRIRNPDSSDATTYMQTMLETRKGEFVVGTRKGLFTFSENDPVLRCLSIPALDGEVIHFLFQDRKGNLFVNGFFKGIYILKPEGRQWKTETFLPLTLNLKCGLETREGILFASTKGLLRLQTRPWKTQALDEPSGMLGQTLYSLIPDPRWPDTYWCSSNKGIFAIQLSTGKYLSLGIQDGLSSLEFNTNAFVRRKNGELAFGSIDGLTCFTPDGVFAPEPAAPWVLDRLELEGIPDSSLHSTYEKQKGRFEVAYEHNGFYCRLVQVSFPHAAGRIRYKLAGHESNWNTGSNPMEIRYSNLPEGEFEFLTEYFDPQEGWIRNRWFHLSVAPPWYRTWWARSLLTVMGLGLILVLVRNYIRQKLEKERVEMLKRNTLIQERNRIISDLHDDVGATLSSISIYSEAIKTKLENQELDRAMDLVLKVGENARESISNLGDIVWNLNPVNDSTQRLLERMESTATVLCSARNTKLNFLADPALNQEVFSLEAKQNLYLIFKEILNNASKYASANLIQVCLEKQGNDLFLSVSDDGMGFDSAQISGGHGLLNIRKRAENLGGTCHMESGPKGTRTEIRIPIQRARPSAA